MHHDRAHVYRAIQESTCYGLELNLRTVRNKGFEPDRITVCGGAVSSRDWMQMHANVTGLDIVITKVQDGPTLGSAMMAAVAAGRFADLQDAADVMVHEAEVFTPDAERHEEYRFWMDQYATLYPAMREVHRAVANHLSQRDKEK